QKKYLNKILNTKADAKREYFLKINAYFLLKTHEYLSDLPPAVENMIVNKNMLSLHTTELVNSLDGGRFLATEKLVPHHGPQKEYVIYYLELQYYVKLGMIVDEVIEILSFDQTNWLTPYIAFNTEKRQGTKNAFEKDFFKLMNNLVYGKTMKNVHKYQDVKLIAMNNKQDEKKFIKQICKLSFKYAKQLGNTLVGAHIGKASVTLNKPIIVGASVLGLSKLLMYRFWHGYVKERYGNKAQLGYMDTDSFIFQVETEDIYKDMTE
ncbi:13475_t:CDS:1, partial [Cetraspora pellucida]